MVRNLVLAAIILSILAGCGRPDPESAGQDAASSQTTSPCAEGCQPGNVQLKMHMTVGQTLVDWR
jgi:uncharacterized lipoprotein